MRRMCDERQSKSMTKTLAPQFVIPNYVVVSDLQQSENQEKTIKEMTKLKAGDLKC